MGLTAKDRQQLQELGKELRKITGGSQREDGTPKTFDELERDAIEVADLIGAAILEAGVRDAEACEACHCPKCGAMAPQRQEPEPRVLQTSRGEVSWFEYEYFCRKCRRAFFPSNQ